MPVSRAFSGRTGPALVVLFFAALLTSCDNAGQKNQKSPDAMLEGFSATSIAGAQQRVDEAIQLAGQTGHEEVIRRINENKTFWDGAAYVFMLNARARTVLANPVFPALVGKHVSGITDADGNSLAGLVDDATEAGAWVEYQWVNPETAKVTRKVSWVKKTGDYIYGSGIYQ